MELISCVDAFGVVAKPVSLPLREALFAYCDPSLAKRWREAKRTIIPPAVHLPDPSYSPSREAEVLEELTKLDPAYIEFAKSQNALRSAMQEEERTARTAVERDFRDRVAAGEVVLEGLQFAPNLATTRSVIPSVWAKLLIFMLMDNVWVGNQKIKFMDVTAYRATALVKAKIGSATVATIEPDTVVAPPRPRGRASSMPLIEAALRANWSEVERRAAKHPEERPAWAEVARLLHKWLHKQHRNSGQQIPHEQTIRTRLPQIYARMMSDKPVRN